MTTWRLTYLGVERSKVNLRHSAAPSVFSSKSVLYKKNTRPGLFMRRLIPPTAVETSSNFTARKMMVHWLNKIVNSCYFTIKIFNWLPRLKLTESDCLGYPGTSTLASHTLNRIRPQCWQIAAAKPFVPILSIEVIVIFSDNSVQERKVQWSYNPLWSTNPWDKARPQHRELCVLLFSISVWVL